MFGGPGALGPARPGPPATSLSSPSPSPSPTSGISRPCPQSLLAATPGCCCVRAATRASCPSSQPFNAPPASNASAAGMRSSVAATSPAVACIGWLPSLHLKGAAQQGQARQVALHGAPCRAQSRPTAGPRRHERAPENEFMRAEKGPECIPDPPCRSNRRQRGPSWGAAADNEKTGRCASGTPGPLCGT